MSEGGNHKNRLVLELFQRAYGQGGAVAVPAKASKPKMPFSDYPAGVDDVLERLVYLLSNWPANPGDAPAMEWCFLVGGPCNGKSEALRLAARLLDIDLPERDPGSPAPRTVPEEWPGESFSIKENLGIAFINDASIPRADVGGASLFHDVLDALQENASGNRRICLFANVNRGILVEEVASLRLRDNLEGPNEKLARDIIEVLALPSHKTGQGIDNPLSGLDLDLGPNAGRGTEYYRRLSLPLKDEGWQSDLVVHIVFLDLLSLLEPLPRLEDANACINFSGESVKVGTYQPLGGLSRQNLSRAGTPGGKFLQRVVDEKLWEDGECRATGGGEECPSRDICPFANNARWLRNPRLGEAYLDLLRGLEIASSSRLTYRELTNQLSQAILGSPETAWINGQHPCDWVGEQQEALSSRPATVAVHLASHRVYNAPFGAAGHARWVHSGPRPGDGDTIYGAIVCHLSEDQSSTRPVSSTRAYQLLDPSHDTDSWDGDRQKAIEAIETLELTLPCEQLADWGVLESEVTSEIERLLDEKTKEEIGRELAAANEASNSRARNIRKWRMILLLRQVGLATGRFAFREAVNAYLVEHLAAVSKRSYANVGKGLLSLVRPTLEHVMFIAPLEPRAQARDRPDQNGHVYVELSADKLNLDLEPIGDLLVANIRYDEVTVASLVVDLALTREALLHVDRADHGFTEIDTTVFARIERARAALIGREKAKHLDVYFVDKGGKTFRVERNPPGSPSPLSTVPTG